MPKTVNLKKLTASQLIKLVTELQKSMKDLKEKVADLQAEIEELNGAVEELKEENENLLDDLHEYHETYELKLPVECRSERRRDDQ